MSEPLPDVLHINELSQARALLHPLRVAALQRLREPMTCPQLAKALSTTSQAMNHHLKAMLEAGLIQVVREERVRNLVRAVYQAAGKVVWLSPRVALDPHLDEDAERDRLSLDGLLGMAEAVQHDVAKLLGTVGSEPVPSLGLRVEVNLADEPARKAFAADVLAALQPIVDRYQSTTGDPFTLTLVCYPKEASDG
ncbi:MAG: helix-turn-helix domain-containing protein [Myxococcota bacterium]